MDIFSVTLVCSILAFVAIGNYAGRSVKQLDDYFVAGRRAPTMFILGTLVASVFSSTIFLGEAGFTYAGQMGPYLLFPGIAVTGYVYGALLFGRYLRRSRAPTVAEYFGQRFDSRRVQQAAGTIIILALGAYLLVVTQGAALLLQDLIGVNYTTGLIIAWLSYTVFTMYSGAQGVVLTDTLMFLLFTAATLAFGVYVVSDLGGVTAAVEDMAKLNAKPGIAAWHGVVGDDTEWSSPWDYLVWAVVIDLAWSVVYAVSPWQSSRHLMARNEHVVIRSAILTCLAVIVLQIFIYGVAGLINLYNPDISPVETVMIWAARSVVPEVLGALLLAGIMAAALSSASTFLSLVGFSASNDITPSKTPLSIPKTRLIISGVSLIALVCAFFFPPNIFWLMLFIGTVFASSWGPVALMSVWSKRITEDAAFWGMITGFVFNVVPAAFEYAGALSFPHFFNPTIIGVLASLMVITVLSKRGVVTETQADYLARLHRAPQSDCTPSAVRTTSLAAWTLVAYGLLMPVVMHFFYTRPYQRGAGQLIDGAVDWSRGEALLPLSSALLFVPLGLFAVLRVRRDYQARPVPALVQQAVLSDGLELDQSA
ncbi:MAG: sodium:solute symporter family protein [Pseudomonadota bacterium]